MCYKKIVDVSGEGARNKRLMEKMALLQAKEKYLQEAKQNFQELQKKRKEMEKIVLKSFLNKILMREIVDD